MLDEMTDFLTGKKRSSWLGKVCFDTYYQALWSNLAITISSKKIRGVMDFSMSMLIIMTYLISLTKIDMINGLILPAWVVAMPISWLAFGQILLTKAGVIFCAIYFLSIFLPWQRSDILRILEGASCKLYISMRTNFFGLQIKTFKIIQDPILDVDFRE